jgi:hypothetical protein
MALESLPSPLVSFLLLSSFFRVTFPVKVSHAHHTTDEVGIYAQAGAAPHANPFSTIRIRASWLVCRIDSVELRDLWVSVLRVYSFCM